MGVRRLTAYVREKILLPDIQLEDTRVIIDGLALVFHLYKEHRIDCRCGGEYDEFANEIRRFFRSLTSKGITPFVLVDGPTYILSRSENEILSSQTLSTNEECDVFLLPHMARIVFLQELKNLDVNFAVCDGGADQELASLANQWNCPVISNDSDFYIYNLPAGYIPMSSLHFNGPVITAKLYQRERLAGHLHISQESLPLFASLMGNDSVSDETLAPFKQVLLPFLTAERVPTETMVTSIANFIRSKSPNEALKSVLDLVSDFSEKAILKKELESSMMEYEISQTTLRGYFEQQEIRTSLETFQNRTIPPYVIRSYRNGMFPVRYLGALTGKAQMCKVQVEDMNEVSANECTIELRGVNYGLLTEEQNHVCEYDRRGTKLIERNVPVFRRTVPGWEELPNLRNIREIGENQRRQLMLIVLKANTAIKALPGRFQLFAASIRFWISEANPRVDQTCVQALLLMHLQLLAESEDESSSASSRQDERHENRRLVDVSFDLECQHSFAQWQAVVTEAFYLNQILVLPLCAPNIATLYSGITAQTIVHQIKQGQQLESLMAMDNLNIFKQLYAAVTEGLMDRPSQ